MASKRDRIVFSRGVNTESELEELSFVIQGYARLSDRDRAMMRHILQGLLDENQMEIEAAFETRFGLPH